MKPILDPEHGLKGATPEKAGEGAFPSREATTCSGPDEENTGNLLPDGLKALRHELSFGAVMGLIERTARWVDPTTFRYLPVWFPEHARGSLFYKSDWSEPQMNRTGQTGVSVHKRESNTYANKALKQALGLRSTDKRRNWSCCHIWGLDDPSFQVSNVVVQDHRFFSCVANMVLLPSPLKAFTDVMVDVKMMMRVCALHFYNWSCDQNEVANIAEEVRHWARWDDYPESWPKPGRNSSPRGLVPFSEPIKKAADRRKAAIRRDLTAAGPHYPHDKVRKALDYWKLSL